MQCLHTGGLYLLDDGFNFIVWLGRMLPPELVSNILGISLANFPDLSKVHLSYAVMRLYTSVLLKQSLFQILPCELSFFPINALV